EVAKAKTPPEITPGRINGTMILKKTLAGDAPRLRPALIKFRSNPSNVAATVIRTKGVPSTVWAMTRPVNVPVNPSLEKTKYIPAEVITSGTIIGEMRALVTKPRAGMFGLVEPSAAKVPNSIDSRVVT